MEAKLVSAQTGLSQVTASPQVSSELVNDDLLPSPQKWNWYDIFAFWMSDVHSVGGYVFAGTLFALGLQSWQILLVLIVGICIVMGLANLIARPSQQSGVPFPVIARLSFGVYGANIPAAIRGIIAIVWYGIQTYLASITLSIILLRLFPGMVALTSQTFLNLSLLGWISFMVMWCLQTALFLMKMNAIKVFMSVAGPAVYVAMLLLMGWIIHEAGWSNISFSLSERTLSPSQAFWQSLVAISLIVAYFAGPVLNFGDFSRYCRSMKEVRRGNFWGLPVNFTVFSLISVIVISGTPTVFGRMIDDPMETIRHIDNTMIVVLLAFTLVTATVGVNIVANFVSAAFDVSNVAPHKISWRTGGLIAALASICITPWNLYNSPAVIHNTIEMLAAVLGPVYGILVVDFYLIRKQVIRIPDLFNNRKDGAYWYRNGINPVAIKSLVPAALVCILCAVVPQLNLLANFSFFIGLVISGTLYYVLAGRAASNIG
ncbi:NCS1 family nucleobase:cation symporter-1 [Cupriavidus campinensis]